MTFFSRSECKSLPSASFFGFLNISTRKLMNICRIAPNFTITHRHRLIRFETLKFKELKRRRLIWYDSIVKWYKIKLLISSLNYGCLSNIWSNCSSARVNRRLWEGGYCKKKYFSITLLFSLHCSYDLWITMSRLISCWEMLDLPTRRYHR